MKNNILKYILISISGLCGFIFSIIKYIQSYEYYSDEWGTDISFNNDYIIAIIIMISVLIYGIYMIYITFIDKKNENCNIYLGLIITTLLSLYPLGVYFKALNKSETMDFYVNYLYIGLVSLFICGYYIINFINVFKEKNKV